jgi:hypothetical protein
MERWQDDELPLREEGDHKLEAWPAFCLKVTSSHRYNEGKVRRHIQSTGT